METKLFSLLRNTIIAIYPLLSFSQTQIGQDIDGEGTGDRFGHRVSISSDGSIIASGGFYNNDNGTYSGQVRVFENQLGTWVQIGQDINGDAASDYLGRFLALSSDGSILAVGAHGNDSNGTDSGHVRVYENQSGNWVQIGQDIEGDAGDGLGIGISLSSDGSILAVGATGNDSNGIDSGRVKVYENQSGTWVQIGQNIDGPYANQALREIKLSSDGSILAIGAPWNSDNGYRSGQVRVFENQSGTWVQIGQDINGETAEEESGWNISMSSDGSIVAIGARRNNDNGGWSGKVRVYENQSGTWVQIGQDLNGDLSSDEFGSSVSLSSDGSVLAVGASGNNSVDQGLGYVRIYENQLGTWEQLGLDIVGQAIYDNSRSVSLSSSGSIIVIGASGSDVNGNNSGQVRVFDLAAILSSDEFVLSKVNLYPNPAKDQFSIQLKEGLHLKKVNIYNNLGQLIQTTIRDNVEIIDFTTGLYYIEIITDKGKTTKQLAIE